MPEVALVTGASSGIGEAFARALSERDHEVVLVARRVDRLERLASELPGNAHIVACDLIHEASDLKNRVDALGLSVDLLVNNAGFGTHGRFTTIDTRRDADQVRLNCEAVVTLTHLFLPGIVERGRGGMIVVASTAGAQPIPYQATYSASKAFVRTFTDALHEELRGTGVRVTAVSPGPVPTEWQEQAGYHSLEDFPLPGFMAIEPEQVVREALAAYDRGRRSVVPGRAIRWFMRASAPPPLAIKLRVMEQMFRARSGQGE
jgi:short-subunit dehydrogenase